MLSAAGRGKSHVSSISTFSEIGLKRNVGTMSVIAICKLVKRLQCSDVALLQTQTENDNTFIL